MSRFMLSMGLVLASLTSLAGAGESRAPALATKAMPSLATFNPSARRGVPYGPYSTYQRAYAQMLVLKGVGFRYVSDPYYVEKRPDWKDGWYIDVQL